MGLFSRKQPEPQGYVPSEEEVKAAADQLNNGSHHAAWDLTLHARDHSQATAMRIMGHCIKDPE